jgi:hypothetical protein
MPEAPRAFHSAVITFDDRGEVVHAPEHVRIERLGPGQYHVTLEAQDGPLTVERTGDRPNGVCA